MKITPLDIPDVIALEPDVFGDDRGFFFESWNQGDFDDLIGPTRFVQDNHSRSARGVVRGLHYQVERPQGKLVRVVRGVAFDVAVDIRAGSPTFGRSVSVELSEDNKVQVWVPPGFAHGFMALTDGTEMLYKATDFYVPECDRAVAWDDPDLAIDWPHSGIEPHASGRDRSAPRLRDAELPT